MPNITDNLLSLESELAEIVKKTAALKQEIGNFSQAREDLLTVRDRLAGAIASLETLLHAQHDTILAIRQTAPDKILEEISKFNAVADSVRKEIENLDEEFIVVKDLTLERINKNKEDIIKSIEALYEKYQLMSDKLYVADDKIIITQERFSDSFKKHEESMEKFKNETNNLVKDQTVVINKHFKLIIITLAISVLLTVVNLVILVKNFINK